VIAGKKTFAEVFAGIVTFKENGPAEVPFQSLTILP
jgi:hypothetical protein